MTADTRTDDEILESLDFAHVPRCEMTVVIGTPRWHVNIYRCRKTAAWQVIVGCCGGLTYICHKHRERPVLTEWFCATCKRWVSHEALRWRRL